MTPAPCSIVLPLSRRRVNAFGRDLTLAEWTSLHGVGATTIRARLDRQGWTPERAVSEPTGRYERKSKAPPVIPTPAPKPAKQPPTRAPIKATTPVVKRKRARGEGTTAFHTAHGLTLTLATWSERTGLTVGTIRSRIGDVARGLTPEQVVDLPVPRQTITAFGETLTPGEWSERSGIPVSAMQSRLRSTRQDGARWKPEDIVTVPYKPTNKPQAPKYQCEPGSPGSISWDVEPFATDASARAFVEAHPAGAITEEICAVMGLHDSQVRETEQQALRKLRTLVLSGDRDALRFLGSLADDWRDTEALLDDMADRYPKADPFHQPDEPTDAMDGELVSLDVLDGEAANDNGLADELSQLDYASASW